MSAPTQCSLILDHLERGNTLTPLDAFTLFNCLALHSRIAELRSRGFDIACEMVKTPSGKFVGQYSLPLRVAYD